MGGEGKHSELASQCSTTLVTESDYRFHYFAGSSLRLNSFWQIRRDCGLHLPEARYDLISVPTFYGLRSDAVRMQKLIENISLAVDVHLAEKVCVLGFSDADSVCGYLRREFFSRFPNLDVKGIFVECGETERERSHRLVVTCMDFRLHHKAGLQGMVTEPSAWLTYPGAAFAGVDQETEEIFFSDLDRVLDREAVTELTLVSHTDCAKYATKYSWRNIKEEMEQLANDLLAIASRIRSRYSHLTVFCVIANVEEGAVKKLYPVW